MGRDQEVAGRVTSPSSSLLLSLAPAARLRPLGLITHPRGGKDAKECLDWFEASLKAGARIYIPEIIDYELRRELLRTHLESGVLTGLAELDALATELRYLPLTTAAMRRAAELWARARNQGNPLAKDDALDVDVILSAQALELAASLGVAPVIATTNPKHLALFTDARHWRDLKPRPRRSSRP